jgi:5-deoxy-glucuronate isomerase
MSWHRPFGTTSRDGWDVVIEPDESGWEHTGLYAAGLAPSESRALASRDREFVVIPLSGSVTVSSEDSTGRHEATLAGRASVFAGPTDVAYVPAGSSFTVQAVGAARVAVAFAVAGKADVARTFRHVSVDEVPVELRGAGTASREVRNFGIPGVLDADSVIACEVITPAGNWSSYPPHKHDEERPGEETQLEEVYYFEVQGTSGAPDGTDPVAYQRVYGTDERPIDVLAEVRTGDVVLVPHGWHGPAMAAPGYDLYYLNVMAGPGPERAWRICDDPAHAWVRDTWADQDIDPRLPIGGQR